MAKKVLTVPNKLKPKISNPQSLRVLMVEDSEDDALLIIRELKKGGYDPVYERVETEKAMSKALKEKPWDVILCDYTLPKFSVRKAIALLKETNIDIPFLLVTGSVGEEVAVECMRLGAHDYIMKNNLSRLCLAIARELKEADSRSKRKQAEEALRQSEEKYRNIIENMHESYFENDLAGNFTFVNDAMCRNTGYLREELIGKNNRLLTDEKNTKKIYQIYNSIYRTGEPCKALEVESIRKSGIKGFAELSVSLIRDAKGNPIGFRAVIRDVTERKQAEEALRETDNQLRATLNALPDLLFDVDAEGTIYDFLAPHPDLLYASPSELLGRTIKEVLSPEAGNVISEAIAEAVKTGRHSGGVYPLELPSGRCWFELSIAAKDNPNSQNPRFIMLARDITARKEAEEKIQLLNAELEQMALTDYLTNLYNRRYFIQHGVEEFKRAKRNSQPLALFILDIDEFKKVNDTYGHEAGDLALQQVAAALKSSLREVDILGRLGGEEFAVLLPNTSLEGAAILAERVRQTITKTSFKTPGDVLIRTITISIGVAAFTDEMSGAEDLLRNADAAMYCAKNSGRNCVRVYKENSDGPRVLPSALDVK